MGMCVCGRWSDCFPRGIILWGSVRGGLADGRFLDGNVCVSFDGLPKEILRWASVRRTCSLVPVRPGLCCVWFYVSCSCVIFYFLCGFKGSLILGICGLLIRVCGFPKG